MTSSTPFKASNSVRKSPFARPARPESPSSPLGSPLRPSLRTATPILHPEDSPLRPASPLRNTTNTTSSPIAVYEDTPIKPVSPLFAKSPASPSQPSSPLRNSTRIPSVNIFEDSFSTAQPLTSPSQLDAPSNPTFALRQSSADMPTPRSDGWTPRGLRPVVFSTEPPPSSPKSKVASRFESPAASSPKSNIASRFESPAPRGNTHKTATPSPAPAKRPSYGARAMSESNAMARLQPGQVRELRECFQMLDRDSDGMLDAEDVKDMLSQLGLPSSDEDIEAFLPAGGAGKSTMVVFLTQVSTLLASLSPSSELIDAFSAFDDDDSGEVDLAELREALLTTMPDQGEEELTQEEVEEALGGFSSRRAFGKTMLGGKRGEVVKYLEFVNTVAGKDKGGMAEE